MHMLMCVGIPIENLPLGIRLPKDGEDSDDDYNNDEEEDDPSNKHGNSRTGSKNYIEKWISERRVMEQRPQSLSASSCSSSKTSRSKKRNHSEEQEQQQQQQQQHRSKRIKRGIKKD